MKVKGNQPESHAEKRLRNKGGFAYSNNTYFDTGLTRNHHLRTDKNPACSYCTPPLNSWAKQ